MPRMVCVACNSFLKIEKNGITVVEMMEEDKPYQLWVADKWKCPGCRVEILGGLGKQPFAIHHEEGFDGILERLRETKPDKLVYAW